MNKIIHERSRLKILTFLAGKRDHEVPFTELQEGLAMSSGNLSVQLKKLNDNNYIIIEKTFKDNKPFTGIMITEEGYDALMDYLDEMEVLIKSVKK